MPIWAPLLASALFHVADHILLALPAIPEVLYHWGKAHLLSLPPSEISSGLALFSLVRQLSCFNKMPTALKDNSQGFSVKCILENAPSRYAISFLISPEDTALPITSESSAVKVMASSYLADSQSPRLNWTPRNDPLDDDLLQIARVSKKAAKEAKEREGTSIVTSQTRGDKEIAITEHSSDETGSNICEDSSTSHDAALASTTAIWIKKRKR